VVGYYSTEEEQTSKPKGSNIRYELRMVGVHFWAKLENNQNPSMHFFFVLSCPGRTVIEHGYANHISGPLSGPLEHRQTDNVGNERKALRPSLFGSSVIKK
jgi:hypothetical protein